MHVCVQINTIMIFFFFLGGGVASSYNGVAFAVGADGAIFAPDSFTSAVEGSGTDEGITVNVIEGEPVILELGRTRRCLDGAAELNGEVCLARPYHLCLIQKELTFWNHNCGRSW